MDKGLFEIQDGKIPNGSLSGKYSREWVEETVDFDYPSQGQKSIPKTRSYLGSSVNAKKIIILGIIIILGCFIAFFRIIQLQIVKGNYYRDIAEGNRIRLRPIASERGIILDRNHQELVQNVPNFSLTIIPQDLPKDKITKEKIIDSVSAYSNVPKEQIYDLLKKYGAYSYNSLVIKENLDYESALKLYIQSAQLPGIAVEKGSKRKYLLDGASSTTAPTFLSASHILGYAGKINESEYADLKNDGYYLFEDIGKTGVEKTYEQDLRGQYGQKKVEVDALGHEQKILAEDPPTAGKNIILSIDIEAQKKLEEIIKNSLARTKTTRAAAVVMSPTDGSILAMVSWPSFDNNDFSGGITTENYQKYINNPDNPLFNRAIAGTYPSGSIVKLIMAAAALEEKIITSKTSVLSTGGIKVDRWFFKDWSASGHGITNVTKALAWSVNTFFYYIGGGYEKFTGLGIDKILQYMQYFGLSKRTGIDLTGEASGFLPTKDWKYDTKGEKWYIGDTYNMSIGQGDLLVTPIQAAVWTAAIANGGTVVQPHVVQSIENTTANTSTIIKTKTSPTHVSAANIAIVKQGMRECVTYGSCQLLKSLSFTAAGKTGTAQWSANKDNHAWFTSFAPLDNPKVVVTILVEEGKEGSTVAEPIALQFLQWWGDKYLK